MKAATASGTLIRLSDMARDFWRKNSRAALTSGDWNNSPTGCISPSISIMRTSVPRGAVIVYYFYNFSKESQINHAHLCGFRISAIVKERICKVLLIPVGKNGNIHSG